MTRSMKIPKRNARAWVAALAALVLFCVTLPLAAEHTRFWRQSRYDEFEKGTAHGVAMRSDGKLLLAPQFADFGDANLAYLWALRFDSKGNLYAAGGSSAKVVRFDPQGKATKVFESAEMTAQALAIDAHDNLYCTDDGDHTVRKCSSDGRVLLTIGIPVILLVFFSQAHVITTPTAHRINFIAPGILALCVLSTSLVALSIATGFERSFGVLRRLHVTPLGRRRLIGAKITGVLATEALQVVVLSLVALSLRWHPHGGSLGAAQVAAVLILGSAGCAGIGLALAGSLRAEVNLAASNGLYLVLLLVSGIVVPVTSLPVGLQKIVVAIPSGAMADGLHRVLGSGLAPSGGDWLSLGVWAVLAPLLAARTFRFD